MTKIRAGLIGFGAMGRNHARIMRSLESVDFVGAYDPVHTGGNDKESLVFNSINELISAKPDFCAIATPTISHEAVAIELIKADISVLIEKPLAIDSSSAKNILVEFEKKNLYGAVGHIERFNSAVINAKKLINEGLIGDIVQISTTRVGPFPTRISDVGVVLDLATHDIDLVQFLTSSKFKTITAHTMQTRLEGKEDLVVVVGLLSSGVLVNQIINWVTPKKKRQVIILGTKGTLEINTLNSELVHAAHGSFKNNFTEVAHINGFNPGHQSEIAFEVEEPLQREYVEFLKGLRGEQSSSVSLNEALEIVSVAESILDSSNRRTTVEIDF
jgi:UDP-N-acetylglucosamine 3-dehydrogenase